MAYADWADRLLQDAAFTEGISVLRQRYMVHNDAVGMVAEGRWSRWKLQHVDRKSLLD
jgi:hypothetical protein